MIGMIGCCATHAGRCCLKVAFSTQWACKREFVVPLAYKRENIVKGMCCAEGGPARTAHAGMLSLQEAPLGFASASATW